MNNFLVFTVAMGILIAVTTEIWSIINKDFEDHQRYSHERMVKEVSKFKEEMNQRLMEAKIKRMIAGNSEQ